VELADGREKRGNHRPQLVDHLGRSEDVDQDRALAVVGLATAEIFTDRAKGGQRNAVKAALEAVRGGGSCARMGPCVHGSRL
jgi:hypothetical protein